MKIHASVMLRTAVMVGMVAEEVEGMVRMESVTALIVPLAVVVVV